MSSQAVVFHCSVVLHVLTRQYIEKFIYYQQRIFECERTGKTGLTFEEALVSESLVRLLVAKEIIFFVNFNLFHSGKIEEAEDGCA